MERRWYLIVIVLCGIVAVQYFTLYGKINYNFGIQQGNTSRNTTFQPPYDIYSVKISELFNTKLTTEQQEELKHRLKVAQNTTKYILDWFGHQRKEDKQWPSEICGKCEFTNDRDMINSTATGAVVFKYNKITSENLPTTQRRNDQLHVWYTAEAPSSLYTMRHMHLIHEDRYKFNLTDTYRRDSGIYHPYGLIEELLLQKQEQIKHESLSKMLKYKTKVAVAVVSNCNRTVGAKVRMQLIEKLIENGLDVDTFGSCYGKPVTVKSHEFESTLKKYKFYLAFENAYHCRDYITEKFFINGLRSGTVPVAWGARKDEYEAVTPSDSFIYAEDYSSIRSLAAYLKYLDKNDAAYLKYFNWISRNISALPSHGRATRFCQLCRQIHGINVDDIFHPSYNASNPERPLFTDTIAKRTVPGLRNWYYTSEDRDCFERSPFKLKKRMNFSDF